MPEELSKMTRNWEPLSKSNPSAMEYLVAVELLPEEQLKHISVPTSLTGELAIIKGLLFSRTGLHNLAIRVLFDNLPMAITKYGEASLEVGIVAAECANCYNMLREESIANRIATRFLALRVSQERLNRQDWFFLNLSLIDSLIGVGDYRQADLTLQEVMANSSIPTSIFAMSCLRLSKIRRRTANSLDPNMSPKTTSHLQTGIELFAQVPRALREEFLEEVACELVAKQDLTKEVHQVESLMDTVNSHVSTMATDTTLAQSRYEKVESSVKQCIIREKDTLTRLSKGKQEAKNAHTLSTFSPSTPPELSTSNDKEPGSLFLVPHPRDHMFVSRHEVTTIADILSKRSGAPSICLMYGEAGIGKSSIATEVAYSCHQEFDVVIWIGSDSPIQFSHRLYSIATQLHMDALTGGGNVYASAREFVIKWLKQPWTRSADMTRSARYLVILDGFDSKEALQPFWPSNSTPCSVLVTARENLSLPGFCESYAIKVGPLSTLQAIQLYEYSTDKCNAASTEVHSKSFGDHPLAIRKVAELARNHASSAWHIDDDFEQRLKLHLSREDFTSQINHSASLIKLWFLSFASQNAKDLLDVISFFHESGVPETLLVYYKLPSNAWDKVEMTTDEIELARAELLEFSLVWRIHETGGLTTSANIGSLVRDHMPPDRFQSIYAIVLSLLHYVWPCTINEPTHIDDYEIEHSARCSLLWPQVRELQRRSQSITVHNLPPLVSINGIRILLDISWHVLDRIPDNSSANLSQVRHQKRPV
ncbi:hypothetical protein ACHAPA_010495 [Fusarium lateritium]